MSRLLQGLVFSLFAAIVPLVAWGQTPGVAGPATGGFRIFDDFQGQLAPDWKPLRPDDSHWSLSKHPGKLTITTQFGSMHQRRPERPLTKNIFLVDCPAAQQGGFVVTACLEGFQPTATWHQAGLVFVDDEDNYMKFVMEFNNRTGHESGSGPIWNLLREIDGQSDITKTLIQGDVSPRQWIRITSRGHFHEYATSTDGDTFMIHGELPWGDGSPKSIGLMATNGGSQVASEIDASFDFFELRSLTPEERDNPRSVDRKKLVGSWKVTKCEIAGRTFEAAPLSQFTFTESTVVIQEKNGRLESEFLLNVSQKPKQIAMSLFSGATGGQVNAIYEFQEDSLTVCLPLKPGAEAPTEFKTSVENGQMLLTLRREKP